MQGRCTAGTKSNDTPGIIQRLPKLQCWELQMYVNEYVSILDAVKAVPDQNSFG